MNGFVFLKVNGKLAFQNNNSTLNLGGTAVIIVTFNGEIMGGGSPSQKIRLNGEQIFNGNDAPISGPQMASATSEGFSFFNEFSLLPVKFVGFTTARRGNDVLVQWATSEEKNAGMYHVERSLDGTGWSTVGYIAAVGNASAVSNYSFTDKNVSAKLVYYRIKQVDYDGTTTYTTIRTIKSDNASANDIKIAAVNKKVLLQFASEVKGQLTVRFVNGNGQVIDQQIISKATGQVVLNSKVSGNYIISLSNGQDINTAKQVIL